ncbi:MAG: hypothetical protein JW878_00975 [Methanomicrobia archaeon]|nr:hypothetical protein [Methanomicrobia archaeon]
MRIDQAKIHRKTLSDNAEERQKAAKRLGSNFSVLRDKMQAWADLHRLTGDKSRYVRMTAAEALGSAFPHVPDKEEA